MPNIIAMFAAREHHCNMTFPAMYLLLSLTVPISRLFIIISVFRLCLCAARDKVIRCRHRVS